MGCVWEVQKAGRYKKAVRSSVKMKHQSYVGTPEADGREGQKAWHALMHGGSVMGLKGFVADHWECGGGAVPSSSMASCCVEEHCTSLSCLLVCDQDCCSHLLSMYFIGSTLTCSFNSCQEQAASFYPAFFPQSILPNVLHSFLSKITTVYSKVWFVVRIVWSGISLQQKATLACSGPVG